MSRTPYVGGNWKLNPSTRSNAQALAAAVAALPATAATVACFVPAPYLAAVGQALEGGPVLLGAQDLHWEDTGAFTGAVSGPMLASLGAKTVLVGHSERRKVFGDTDAEVGLKLQAAQRAGLDVVLCIGETQAERDAGETAAVNARQLDAALDGISTLDGIVIAYEPVWAIGTGLTATPAMAQDAHAQVRRWLRARFGAPADTAVVLYGGSVKRHNAAELFAQPDIDGGLIGGASLDADHFGDICAATSA